MMTTVDKILKYHPSLIHADTLQQVIAPLKRLGISYFSHARVYASGMVGGHGSHPEFLRFYYENGYHHNDLHLAEPDKGQSYILWDIVEHYGKTAELYKIGADFGVYHTFTIIQSEQEQKNYYHFAVKPGNSHINQFYLQHIHLLEKFILYYNNCLDTDTDLKKAFNYTFEPDISLGGYQSKIMATNYLSQADKMAYLDKLHNKSKLAILSKRELECLSHVAHGLPPKNIAIMLGIGQKTVYRFLENAKQKLHCYSKAELVQKYWENP